MVLVLGRWVAAPGGGIGNGWMSGFSNDAAIFVNTLVIGRLVPVLAAWMVLRSVIDWSEGYTPLASILGAMFLLAIPATAALLQGWNDGTRFGTAAVLKALGHTRPVELCRSRPGSPSSARSSTSRLGDRRFGSSAPPGLF